MKGTFIKLLLIICCCLPLSAAAAPELIQNSSFEAVLRGYPLFWEFEAFEYEEFTTYSITEGTPHSGLYCLTIDNLKANDARFMQRVNIKPGTVYRLSCWIQTENIGPDAKGVTIGVMESPDCSREIKGTNTGWQYIEYYAQSGPVQKRITVAARIGGFGSMNTGKARFDDFILEEVPVVPAGVIVLKFYEKEALTTAQRMNAFFTIISPAAILLFAFIVIILMLSLLAKKAIAGKAGPGSQNLVKNITGMLVSTLATLLVLELVFGIFAIRPAYPKKDFIYSNAFFKRPVLPGVPWEPLPYAESTFKYYGPLRDYLKKGPLSTKYNSLGFREYEYDFIKKPGAYRIVGLGDSFGEGEGVRFDDIWSKVMERKLNTTQPAHVFEVVNLSRAGYDTWSEEVILKTYGLRYAPDLVILHYVLNDPFDTGLVENGYKQVTQANLISDEFQVYKDKTQAPFSLLWYFFTGKMQLLKITKDTLEYYNLIHSSVNKGAWEDIINEVDTVRRLCEENGSRFLVVIWPMFINLKNYPLQPAHDNLKAAFTERGILFLDLADAYRKYGSRDLGVHVTDLHPNELAHAIAAETIYTYITANGWTQ